METLSEIIASFDIFQILLTSLSYITDPLIDAMGSTGALLLDYLRKLFVAHPGLTIGLVVFLAAYLLLSLLQPVRRYFVPSLRPVKKDK